MTVQSQKSVDTILWNWTQITDAATITANLDCGNAAYATVRIFFGAEQSGSATATVLSLLVSQTTHPTNFTTVTANLAPDCQTTHMVRYEVDCKARGRYLRLSFSASTTGGSGDQSSLAFATLHRRGTAPSGASALSASTDDTVVIVSG